MQVSQCGQARQGAWALQAMLWLPSADRPAGVLTRRDPTARPQCWEISEASP